MNNDDYKKLKIDKTIDVSIGIEKMDLSFDDKKFLEAFTKPAIDNVLNQKHNTLIGKAVNKAIEDNNELLRLHDINMMKKGKI